MRVARVIGWALCLAPIGLVIAFWVVGLTRAGW
jgi:hypothetical protein